MSREEVQEMLAKVEHVLEITNNLREYIQYSSMISEINMQSLHEAKQKSSMLDELKKIKEINGLIKEVPSKLQEAEELVSEFEKNKKAEAFIKEISN